MKDKEIRKIVKKEVKTRTQINKNPFEIVSLILGVILILVVSGTLIWTRGVNRDFENKIKELEKHVYSKDMEVKNEQSRVNKQALEITELKEQVTDLRNRPISKPEVVGCSKSLSGWKEYTSEEYGFSVSFPGEWTISQNILYNEQEKTAVKLPRNLITNAQQDPCFPKLTDYENGDFPSKIISENDIRIGNKNGKLQIRKTIQDPGGGTWYPHTYCMGEENKRFFITLYAYDLMEYNSKLAEKIISTIEFEK